MSPGPLAHYRQLCADGKLQPDTSQELAAEKLQSLHNALAAYQPGDTGGWRARFGLAQRRATAPQGLYLYGGVGRGKSMMMDLFYRTAPVVKKRRTHFHSFMIDVHDRWHAWREAYQERKQRRRRGTEEDPMPFLASAIADETWLLCFDEFHVTDVADAMILGRLFTALFDLGVVVVATSNWPPDELYKDGLQRERFLPFIDLLKQRLDLLELDGGVDYRLNRLRGRPVYHHPADGAASRALREIFAELTDGSAGDTAEIKVKGRTLQVPREAHGVAWFGYEDLCEQPLGAADYLAVAKRYSTVIVEGVPRFREEKRNEAKRFMILIDTLYEHRVKTVIAADAPAERLFDTESHAFELGRTISRLIEMQSDDYMRRRHIA